MTSISEPRNAQEWVAAFKAYGPATGYITELKQGVAYRIGRKVGKFRNETCEAFNASILDTLGLPTPPHEQFPLGEEMTAIGEWPINPATQLVVSDFVEGKLLSICHGEDVRAARQLLVYIAIGNLLDPKEDQFIDDGEKIVLIDPEDALLNPFLGIMNADVVAYFEKVTKLRDFACLYNGFTTRDYPHYIAQCHDVEERIRTGFPSDVTDKYPRAPEILQRRGRDLRAHLENAEMAARPRVAVAIDIAAPRLIVA